MASDSSIDIFMKRSNVDVSGLRGFFRKACPRMK